MGSPEASRGLGVERTTVPSLTSSLEEVVCDRVVPAAVITGINLSLQSPPEAVTMGGGKF